VFLTAVYAVLTMFLSFSRVAQAQDELQSDAEAAIVSLAADLADSHAGSSVTSTSPPGIVLLSPRSSGGTMARDSSGALYYQRWVCYWLDTSSGKLERASVSISPTPTAPSNPYTPSSFPKSGATVLAADMISLTLTGSAPVEITATFATTVKQTHDMQMSIRDAINPRN
jgi:hypothetical protein